MNIEIPVSELKAVLPGLAKIVPRSNRLPVLQCIKVSQDEGGTVLQAHNLEEIATVRLQGTGGNGQLLVPLDLLAKITKGCAADQTIGLVSTGTETRIRYTVAGSSVERSVTHLPVSEWPAVKVINDESITLDETFKTALKEATECASEDSSRHVLNGACLDVRDKDAHYVVGSDGRHLYAANTFRFDLSESLIVPTRKFLGWPGFNDDGPWKLRMVPAVRKGKEKVEDQPAWFRIDSDRWSYVARAIEGVYPSWKQVVPGDTAAWTRIDLQPEAVDMLIESLPLLPGAESGDRPVTLAVGSGLVIKAKGKDQPELSRLAVPHVSVSGNPVQTTLNRTFLLRALRFGLHHIAIKSSLDPLVFFNETKTLVVMPLRGESSDPPAPEEHATHEPQNISVAMPSAAESNNQTEERKPMSTTTSPAADRDNLRVNRASSMNGEGEAKESQSAFRSALEHLDQIKVNLRELAGDLNQVVSLLKTAEREQRTSAREIEAARAKLREIQSVAI